VVGREDFARGVIAADRLLQNLGGVLALARIAQLAAGGFRPVVLLKVPPEQDLYG
jgi:hypothetical protein